MKNAHVRKLRDMKADVPGAANFRVKQISALFGWAVKNDLAEHNPAEKLDKLGGRSEGYYTWTHGKQHRKDWLRAGRRSWLTAKSLSHRLSHQ